MFMLVFVDIRKFYLLFFELLQAEFVAQCKVCLRLPDTYLTFVYKQVLCKVEMLYRLPCHL